MLCLGVLLVVILFGLIDAIVKMGGFAGIRRGIQGGVGETGPAVFKVIGTGVHGRHSLNFIVYITHPIQVIPSLLSLQ